MYNEFWYKSIAVSMQPIELRRIPKNLSTMKTGFDVFYEYLRWKNHQCHWNSIYSTIASAEYMHTNIWFIHLFSWTYSNCAPKRFSNRICIQNCREKNDCYKIWITNSLCMFIENEWVIHWFTYPCVCVASVAIEAENFNVNLNWKVF